METNTQSFSSWNDQILSELLSARERERFRKIPNIEYRRGARLAIDGREVISFCGNDYLGLSQHEEVKRTFQEAAKQHGVGSGAARLIMGSSSIHQALETKLAEIKNKEKSVLYSTGYLANVGVLSALAGRDDVIVMDKLCHASIIDGARLSGATVRVFPHLNYSKCEAILKNTSRFRRRLLVSETVFSMDGDVANLEELIRLKQQYDCLFVVDDAHGLGVLGPKGMGAAADKNIAEKVDAVVGTLSKGLGCIGGFVAGSEAIVEYLVNFSRPFIFATSLPPAVCQAALAALEVLEKDEPLRNRLWANVHRSAGILETLGVGANVLTPIIPIILGSEKAALEASQGLYEKGVLISAIRPPTVPANTSRLRLTLSALHTDADFLTLESALSCLPEIKAKEKIGENFVK